MGPALVIPLIQVGGFAFGLAAGVAAVACRGESRPSPSEQPSSSSADIASMEVKDKTDDGLCTICFVNKKDAVTVDCGHNAGCMTCMQLLHAAAKMCPICRQTIKSVIRIYSV